jgi:sugar lactone lactonase YvrE
MRAMRILHLYRNGLWICAAAAMLAGCAQIQPPLAATEPASRGSHPSGKILDYLYVSDQRAGEVEVYANGSYQKVGAISRGIQGPLGLSLDNAGNLYVANFLGDKITEYAHGVSRAMFRYDAGMKDPVNVSVDREGNVYEADFDGQFVNEYHQGSNKVLNSCAEPGAVSSVAVDAGGDVFVAVNSNSGGRIAEFAGGLSGCHGKVSIDKNNALVFVADKDADLIAIIDYSKGKRVSSLGSANGLSKPAGVVDEPNAVY